MHEQRFDVIVVGGGIIGWSTAYHLQQLQAGSIAVIDASTPSVATTGAGAGFVGEWAAGFGPAGWGKNELAVEQYSLDFYKALGRRADIQLRENGNLFLARTKAGYDAYIAPMLTHPLTPHDIQQLDPAGIVELTNGAMAQDQVYGATYHPRGIQIHTTPAVRALAAEVCAQGGTAISGQRITELVLHDGRITGVMSSDGTLYHAPRVILACGAWINELVGHIGVQFPLYRVVATRVIGNPSGIPETLPTVMIPEQGAWLREHHGGLLWGTGDGYQAIHTLPGTIPVGTRPHYPHLVTALTDAVQASFQQLFPQADLAVREWTQGVPVYTVDRKFISGQVPGVKGLFVTTGDNESGVTHGPGMGKMIAETALGLDVTWLDADTYIPGRFTQRYRDEAAVGAAMPPRR